MYTPFYPFHWLAFEPTALCVHGRHFPESLPVHPRLQSRFTKQLPHIYKRIIDTPGGFDGDCAALLHWEYQDAGAGRPAQLQIATGYRLYTHGHTLKTVLLEQANTAGPNTFLATQLNGALQPIAGMSWGSSLTTVVLLPNNQVLMGQRSPHMQTNPLLWSCLFTEALEPSDIHASNMDNVLARLAHEELACLQTLGTHRFVGLVLLPLSYTWTLVSVMDLRSVPMWQLTIALAELQPDAETQAWSAHTLATLPGLLTPDTRDLLGLALAQNIVDRLS